MADGVEVRLPISTKHLQDPMYSIRVARRPPATAAGRLSLDPPICVGGAPVWTRQAAPRPDSGPCGACTRPVALRVTPGTDGPRPARPHRDPS
jgi:hypothetical protein